MYIDMSQNVFSKNLRFLRTLYEVPAKALANLIGLDVNTLLNIESQIPPVVIPVDAFFRICHIFDVAPKEITTDDLTPLGEE
ncbi:MAG: helix-turn-helix transcriptional regulator [Ruminococcaceae bacterium]|nr:helix-turn-helix transcriptional regulator [Oscillospiraceae bacterium]